MAIDFEAKTTQLPHHGEKGAAREEVVRAFLSEYLPKRFSVSHGFIVDASGDVSRQMDVVIYDQLACPVFHVTPSQRLIPAEGVSGVVSVKSALTRSELHEAANNLSSVATLNRLASGRPEAMIGGVPVGEHEAHQSGRAEPIFTSVFAFDSASLGSVAENLHELNRDVPPELRIQLICVLNRGIVTYAETGVLEPTYSASAQVALVENTELALPLFYAFLANQVMRKVPLSISLRAYLQLDEVEVRTVG
jgi:hypothetical protein